MASSDSLLQSSIQLVPVGESMLLYHKGMVCPWGPWGQTAASVTPIAAPASLGTHTIPSGQEGVAVGCQPLVGPGTSTGLDFQLRVVPIL